MRARHNRAVRVGLCVLLAVVLLTSGCWDRREIEEYSTSLATGIDLCEEGQGCTLVSTRQVAIPGRIALGAEPGAGGGDAQTVTVIRSEGSSGPDTASKAQVRLNHRLNFGHTRVILLGEQFARHGTGQYLDYLRRLPELRRLTWIAVAEGKAEPIIRAKPPLERVPALFLNDLIEDAVEAGRMPDAAMGQFLAAVANEGQDAVAPLLRLARPDHPEWAGLAVFHDDTMVGKLSRNETATYLQLRGIRSGNDLLRVEVGEGNWADLVIRRRYAQYQLQPVHGRLNVSIKLDLEAEVHQLSGGVRGDDPMVLRKLERIGADEVTQRAEGLLRRLQGDMKADVLAVGERVRASYPAYWRSVRDWPDVYEEVRFIVDATVHVRRTSFTTD